MTHTPRLTWRVVALGVGVVAVTLVLANVAVFGLLSARLSGSVDDLLTERAGAVRAEADVVRSDGGGPAELADRLQARGLQAEVTAPDGTVVRAAPTSPFVGRGLPSPGVGVEARTRQVALDDGTVVEIRASTAGVRQAMRELVAIQGLTSVAAVLGAAMMLTRTVDVVLRPVTAIAETATRTREGARGERLQPDDPTTELGRMATAYDSMLDALETSLALLSEADTARALAAAVVEGSTDAILVQGLDGAVLTWNRAAETTLGWTTEEVLGRHVSVLVPPEEMPRLSALVDEVVRTGGVRGYEGERVTKAGGRLPVSVRLSPVRDEDGTIVGVAAGARDVTEQRWMAATLNATLSALETAVAEAEASEQAARRFLADAAHQLRTPVAGIRASAEALLRGAGPQDAERLMITMVRETSRASRLIASLLRMARLDQGVTAELAPVDLVRLCEDEVERLSLLSPDLDIRLETVGTPHTQLVTDAAGCEEVLANLGDNARRHARSAVRIRIEADADQTLVRVVDDGPGLRGEDRERVFERFVSLDGRGGSGLGLPIARGIARSLGGDLTYDDGFVLAVPFAAAARTTADGAPLSPSSSA